MGLLLLISLLISVSAVPDPCSDCPLPNGFTAEDASLCQNVQNDTTYAPILLRHAYENYCYLQLMDCPAYDVVSGSQCVGILPPQQGLQCVDGKFRTAGMTMGFPIDKFRCNEDAYITPPPTSVSCDECIFPAVLSAADTTSCGSAGSTTDTLQMTKTSNGTHCLLILANCGSYNLVTGYDAVGTCRIEENVVGICENGRFKLNGREIYKARCASSSSAPECNGDDWEYNWMTDSYFKLVQQNTTFEEAKAGCIADGGQLASIHSQEENDFIVIMAYMQDEAASVGQGIFIWLGVESDGAGGFRNLDGTPFNYSYWDSPNPSGDGPCVHMYTGINTYDSGLPGQWNDLTCSAVSEAYVCRKNPPCSFKPLEDGVTWQSCFPGGPLKLGDKVVVSGIAPHCCGAGRSPGENAWTINLYTSTGEYAMHIVISNPFEWSILVFTSRITGGWIESARYDSPVAPEANYTLEMINNQDQLMIVFNGQSYETYFASNPENDYWRIGFQTWDETPKLYNVAVIRDGVRNELELGECAV